MSGNPNSVKMRSTHMSFFQAICGGLYPILTDASAMQIMLKQLHGTENPDLIVEHYGTLRNRSGIKLRLSHVEFMSDKIMDHWRTVLSRHGFSSNIEYESTTQVATITGREKRPWYLIPLSVGVVWLVAKVIWQFVL